MRPRPTSGRGRTYRDPLHGGRHSDPAFRKCAQLGLETVGFLMPTHMSEPAALAEQARIMADAGASVCTSWTRPARSSRRPQARVEAVRQRAGAPRRSDSTHTKTSACGVGNTIAAIDAGAVQIDGSLCAHRRRRWERPYRGARGRAREGWASAPGSILSRRSPRAEARDGRGSAPGPRRRGVGAIMLGDGPVSTRASCSTPSAPLSATTCRRAEILTGGWPCAATSAARRT